MVATARHRSNGAGFDPVTTPSKHNPLLCAMVYGAVSSSGRSRSKENALVASMTFLRNSSQVSPCVNSAIRHDTASPAFRVSCSPAARVARGGCTAVCPCGNSRDQVIAALKAHEREIRAAGVLSLSLFGSVARGEESAHDVDLAARLGENFSSPGLAYLQRLEDLEAQLAES